MLQKKGKKVRPIFPFRIVQYRHWNNFESVDFYDVVLVGSNHDTVFYTKAPTSYPDLWNIHLSKGRFQKRFSGFCPLRGGGDPPIPLRKKTFFFSHWFPVKGGGGVPPNSVKEKNLLFRSKNSIFCLFLCIFSPFWTIIWPFGPIFNLI